jgi:hypothetical protein
LVDIFLFRTRVCVCAVFVFSQNQNSHNPGGVPGLALFDQQGHGVHLFVAVWGLAGGIMFQVSALSLHSEPSWDIIFDQVPFTCVLLPPFWADGAYRGPWSTD